jgi:hypothetical protein
MPRKSDKPEQPSVEPEIIPPDRTRQGVDWRQPAWSQSWRPHGPNQASGTYRVYVGRVGPFGIAMLMLAFAILAFVIFFAVLGAVLIWIPVIAALVVVAAIFRFLRR